LLTANSPSFTFYLFPFPLFLFYHKFSKSKIAEFSLLLAAALLRMGFWGKIKSEIMEIRFEDDERLT
jgi:hypothetical protein